MKCPECEKGVLCLIKMIEQNEYSKKYLLGCKNCNSEFAGELSIRKVEVE